MIRVARRVSEKGAEASKREGRTQAERRDEAERKILEAAADIVAQGGFEAVTLAEAGARAGYSRGLPSHYFRTKDDLLSALAVFVVESFMARRRASSSGATGFEGLIESFRLYFRRPLESPTLVRAFHAVLASALNTPAVAATVAQVNRDSAAEIAAGIRAGIAAGRLRDDIDPDMQGVLILATLRGSVAQWLADPERIDLQRLGENYISSLERSIAK
ncbi:TetR/AcrR family transcriptional regulator [Bradyrhizobium sp. KBS0727]|uniref:TetR/AcrR family transcriptional regulator n=1 Tax=unclassified Bradyrhizobium TaxID=2631580 RepID=UPI00110D78E1|nr:MULTISPECIES: TetR/AcrR family transcriptional regulator [unclassified Bradyrhizobium]QDW40636.1 TetR/AcrR family transcriptional regulator [Bradyrhizobium sp. KBS0725]QDW47241.1 TetR/AcrR family transcriptional regulator [Bradyrhizobium sp. KBS0727]